MVVLVLCFAVVLVVVVVVVVVVVIVAVVVVAVVVIGCMRRHQALPASTTGTTSCLLRQD